MVEISRTWMEGDLVHFELVCSGDIFRPLSASLVALGELAHALNHKKRIASAGIRQTPEQLQFVQEHQKKFRKLIMKHFKACKLLGLTDNQAVSEANKAMKDLGQFNTSYDIVRTIVRQESRK